MVSSALNIVHEYFTGKFDRFKNTLYNYYKEVKKDYKMTEEIIIDGVNVAGCGFRHKETDNQCHIALAFSEDYGECWHCEQIEDCYYKQLQHLKQENFALTMESQQKSQTICDLYQEVSSLKEENYNLYVNAMANEYKEEKYRKVLEEVGEICKTMLQGVSSKCINITPYLTAISLMETKINEVLEIEV